MSEYRLRDVYIFKSGALQRYQNTVKFTFQNNGVEDKKILPVTTLESLHCFGQVSLNSTFLSFAGQKSILIHFYDWHGHYVGSFVPRKKNVSGYLLVRQVEAYLNPVTRLAIAREIVSSTAYNIRKNIRYFSNRLGDLGEFEQRIESLQAKISSAETITELMGLEGDLWQSYFIAWDKIIDNPDFAFEARTRRPPLNRLNALISFGNTLLYSEVVKQIQLTALNPTISYLHEPFERRLSLALDLAEMFKPVIVDRLIIHMLRSRELDTDDFVKGPIKVILKDAARRKFIERFQSKLNTTVRHRKLKRNVSYRSLIRLECYKLVKFLTERIQYEGFKVWWV